MTHEINDTTTGSLRPPPDIEPYDSGLSTMWFDNEGIFCSVTHKEGRLNKESLMLTFKYIEQHKKTSKICWIGDVTDAPPVEKEARDFAALVTPGLVKALALITNSIVAKMMAELFLMLKKPPYPTKLFTSEIEARKWIRNYL